jgi:tetratricopeptide (TPR) repeat protein
MAEPLPAGLAVRMAAIMADKNNHSMRKRFRDSETAELASDSLPVPMDNPNPADGDWTIDDFLPPGANIDRVSAVGKPREFQRFLARELMWRTDDFPDFLGALSLAIRAVRIDPACLDARLLLATFAAGPADEYIEELRRIVAVGEHDLGEKFFRENHGHFWLVMETRPYMRVRSALAEALRTAGRSAEAIAEFESLLALNPNDNQGLRYPLLGCYLEEERLDRARHLFRQFEGEGSAMFDWGQVLERYLFGDLEGAVAALARARRNNSHVESFLTGKKKLPKSRPDYYEHHEVSEALVCVDTIGGAWKRHEEAVRWLKKEHGTGILFALEVRPKSGKRTRKAAEN